MPTALGFAALLAGRLLGTVESPLAALSLLLGLAVGWVGADLASGLVHWWADRVAREDLPWIGPSFVRPFRIHHEEPASICANGFLDTNGHNCIVALPVLVAGLLLLPPQPRPGALLGTAFLLSLATWSCFTNQIHKWAHQPSVHPALRRLQRCGVLLSPAHHAGHHTPPYRSRYCITAGWLDPAIERLGLFPALERRLGLADAEAGCSPGSRRLGPVP